MAHPWSIKTVLKGKNDMMSAKNNSLDIKHARWNPSPKGEGTGFHGHMLESAANVSKGSAMSNLKCCCYWLGQRFDLMTRK